MVVNRRRFIRNSAVTSGGWLLMPSLVYQPGMPAFAADSKPAGISPYWLDHVWNGVWINYPVGSLRDYGVFHFRRTFDLKHQPGNFLIHVSADNRYRLFVNGMEVGNGPSRGDLDHWRFESFDIAKYLHPGKNVMAAVVWNFSRFAPLAQISYETAFIVQGNTRPEEIVNTGKAWKVYKNEGYIPPGSPAPFTSVGPGVEIAGLDYPFGWELPDFDDRSWVSPGVSGRGVPFGKFTGWNRMLVPRTIPVMEHTLQRIPKIVRAENIIVGREFLAGDKPLYIKAFTKVQVLLDQNFLTTAYPEIKISGGKQAVIKIGYAEALVDEKGRKGNRNETKGKHLKSAFWDVFKPDGGRNRKFSTLWFRTYRYIALTIETKEHPLTIHDLYGYFTAYPFKTAAYFKSSDPVLERIWETGWRTARLCAGETYYDCPYYEQLQYIGDTRIQALTSLYVSGDDRLMRKAVAQFYHSSLPMGLTQSRYPCSQSQIIPPFSLFWIIMIHDFWMHRDDPNFVKGFLHGIKQVLWWYRQQIAMDGLTGPMDWWNFIDWSFGPWSPEKPSGGVPPGGMEGGSSVITLLFAYALQKAADLFRHFNDEHAYHTYTGLSAQLIECVRTLCWDHNRGLVADTPEKSSFSQHANILGILCGMFEKDQGKEVMNRILDGSGMVQTTYYFKFYLFRALNKTDLADKYLQLLTPWKDMLSLGLTTFAETPEPTRSDCHGWSAHPAYDLLATVCGITPGSPGFKTVEISPNPGDLRHIEGELPHPRGAIRVCFKFKRPGDIEGVVTLPENLSGKLKWKNKILVLKPGKQYINQNSLS